MTSKGSKLNKISLTKFFKSYSVISLLLLTASISLIGTDYLFNQFISSEYHPPREILAGEIIEHSFAVGRGQIFSLKIRTNASLNVFVLTNSSLESHLIEINPDAVIYNQTSTLFKEKLSLSEYSVIKLLFDNSDSDFGVRILTSSFSVEGLDYDVLSVSSIILVLAFLSEIIIRFRGRKTDRTDGYSKYQTQERDSHLISSRDGEKETKTSYSSMQALQLLLTNERTMFPSSLLFGILISSFLMVNPSNKILSTNPTMESLTIYLSSWLGSVPIFSLIWILIVILIGFSYCKSKYETHELRRIFTLSIDKRLYAVSIILILGGSSILLLLIPYLTAFLIAYLRFLTLPDIPFVIILIFWMISWEILILFSSCIIGLYLPRWPLISIVFGVYALIVIGLDISKMIFPEGWLLPFPNYFLDFISLFSSSNLSGEKILLLLGSCVILIFGILYIFTKTIEGIQIE